MIFLLGACYHIADSLR